MQYDSGHSPSVSSRIHFALAPGRRSTHRRVVHAQERRALLRRIEAWDRTVASEFGESCVAAVDELGTMADFAADARELVAAGDVAGASFVAARAAETTSGTSAYDAERQRQAAWLVDRLELAHR